VLGDLMVFWSSRGSGVTGSWIIKLYWIKRKRWIYHGF
jgi:hypothetical protein